MKHLSATYLVLFISLFGGHLAIAGSSKTPTAKKERDRAKAIEQSIRSAPLEHQARLRQQSQRCEAARKRLKQWRKQQQIPGIAVAIISGRYALSVEGFGWRDVVKKQPVTNKTLFAIGSTTKAMTATGLAHLAERRKLRWERPIRKYLPGFSVRDRFASARMNAIDLLTHRSGLPRHDLVWYGSKRTRKQLFQSLRYLDFSKDFRTHFQYNNLMYMVAGMLVGRLGHMSWEAYTRKHIFKPLAISDVVFSVDQLKRASDRALPYVLKGGKIAQIPYRNIDAIGPAGSVNAHILDMAKWLRFNMGKMRFAQRSPLKARTLRKLHTPHMVMNTPKASLYQRDKDVGHISYGLGWMITTFRGHKLVFHAGGIDGFSSIIGFLPKKKLGFALLSNKGRDPTLFPVMLEVFDRMLGAKPVDRVGAMTRFFKKLQAKTRQQAFAKATPHTKPSHPLSAFAGRYTHPAYGQLELKAAGQQLKMRYHTLSFTFKHFHYNVFQAVDGKGKPLSNKFKIVFHLDKKGNVSKLTVPWQAGVPDIAFKPTASLLARWKAEKAKLEKMKKRIERMLMQKTTLGLIGAKNPTARGNIRDILSNKPVPTRSLDNAIGNTRPITARPIAQKPQARQVAPRAIAARQPAPTRPTARKPALKKPEVRQPGPKPIEVKRPVPRRPVAKAPMRKKPTPRPTVPGPVSPETRLTSRKAPSYRNVRTFAEAVAVATREKKPIFLDLYAEWCVPCKKLEAKTFPHPLIHPLLSRYVVVRFDTDKSQGKRLVWRFRVKHYPTTLLLNSRGQVVERIIGFYSARYFRRPVEAALQNKGTYQQLRKAVAANPNDLVSQLQLADRMVMRRKADEARAIYMKLWKADPTDAQGVGAWALFGVARSYARMGRYELAGLWVQQFRAQYQKPTAAQVEMYRLQLFIYKRRGLHEDHASLLKTFQRLFPGRSHIYK